MHKKKMLICLLLCAVLHCMFAVAVMAETMASGTCGENVTWVLDDEGVLTIAGTGPMDNCLNLWEAPWADYRNQILSVEIMDGVTTIGKSAFYYCSKLTSVTIPDSVTRIEDAAFHLCQTLPSITLPNRVTYIGKSVFYSCGKLTSITIPGSVKHVGEYAFSGCSNLKNVVISIGVQSIGEHAFYYCQRLTTIALPTTVTEIGTGAFDLCESLSNIYATGNPVYSAVNGVLYNKDQTELIRYPLARSGAFTIPSSVKKIADSAFSRCNRLTSITIPESVTQIGNSAFHMCKGLTSVTIPGSVEHIGNSAFAYCDNLNSVAIPHSVTSIGNAAFEYCKSLPSVTIPDRVESLGERVFCRCSGLQSVYIGKSVFSIGQNAFQECSVLRTITVSEENAYFSSANGILYNKDQTELLKCPDTMAGVFVVPDSVKRIGDYSFECCKNLTGVVFPDGLESIGAYAFYSSYGITSVTIPDCVTGIGEGAFWIVDLQTAHIGSGVMEIGERCFWGCDDLQSITVAEDNKAYSAKDGVLYDKDKTVLIVCPPTKTGEFIIPDSVEHIEKGAFYRCRDLTSIIIGNGVKSIGEFAFEECEGLTQMVIPSNVESIGKSAFEICFGLKTMIIGDGVTSAGVRIEEGAFGSCEYMETLVIGNHVAYMGDYAFSCCWNLKTIVIMNGVKINNVGYRAFHGCTNLDEYSKNNIAKLSKGLTVTETGKAEDNKLQVTVELDQPQANTAIMVSTYDADGRFVGVATKEMTEKSGTTIIEVEAQNATEIRTLLWQSVDTMTPLSVPDSKILE